MSFRRAPTVDGEYVKAVGDALMLRVPDPADAVRLGLWITRNAMSGHEAPSVRVGGNHGSAVERNGDYFVARSMSRRGSRPLAGMFAPNFIASLARAADAIFGKTGEPPARRNWASLVGTPERQRRHYGARRSRRQPAPSRVNLKRSCTRSSPCCQSSIASGSST